MKKCIMQIVGNRPQFIKLAPVSKEIRKRGYEEVIIHSGQHFDENMSDVFFKELNIPKPDRNLHIFGGSHAEMTAKMMIAVEDVLLEYMPLLVIVYGDTNTTLAAAVVARKLNIPIVHIEAGPRTGNKNNPEEINRVIVDHISELLCAPDRSSYQNLLEEGLADRVFFAGDVMYDVFVQTRERVDSANVLAKYSLEKDRYVLMTWHRQENTTDIVTVRRIVELLEQIEEKIVCPLHPRTKKVLLQFELWERILAIPDLYIIDPVGYLDMVALTANCRMILTDSGGLSKESFFAGVRCLFMVDLRVWPELEDSGWICHMYEDNKRNIEYIKEVFAGETPDNVRQNFYGDGNAAAIIVGEMEKRFGLKGWQE